MKCSICNRALFHDATNGLSIGPVCARRRSLLPERARRVRQVGRSTKTTKAPAPDNRQMDWIQTMSAGP